MSLLKRYPLSLELSVPRASQWRPTFTGRDRCCWPVTPRTSTALSADKA